MHILEIPSFFTPYGGEFCLEQAKALKALGHEVRILSNVQLGITIGGKDFIVLPSCRFEHLQDGVTVCQSYQRGVPLMIHHNVKRWIAIVRSMFEDYLKRYGKPDILHAHCAKWAGYAAMLISKDYGVPYVITEHLPKMILEAEFGKNPADAWQIPMLKEAYQKANMVVPVSEELVDEIACYFGKDYQYTTIPNMIDVDFFAYRERIPVSNRPFRFCCLALFDDRKGYDVLFAAFDCLFESGEDVELHIAGMGTDSKKCKDMMAACNAQSRIYAHGKLDKQCVRDLLYESDALVLATRNESQGLVLLEAMSTGIPAISTAAIPHSARIDDGCSFVPVDDIPALAAEMQKAMNANAFDGEAISKKVRDMASPMVIGRKLTELFSQIIA